MNFFTYLSVTQAVLANMDVFGFAFACIVACTAYLALRPSSQIRDTLDGTYDYIIGVYRTSLSSLKVN